MRVSAILAVLLLAGCGDPGTFVRTRDGYITLTPHAKGCRCEGTAERWVVEGGVIRSGAWLGNEPLETASGRKGRPYARVTGTVEENAAGNAISLDAMLREPQGTVRRSGRYYLAPR